MEWRVVCVFFEHITLPFLLAFVTFLALVERW